jgi:hypothetical protein
MQAKNGETTDIWVITDSVARSGVVTLYVSNGIDTISKEFMIVKKMIKSIKLVGDTACIAQGDGLEYFMYPSPDVEVNWYLPTGWDGDELNPHSSSVYLGVGENAVSGYIVVYTAICNELLDSVAVSVQSLYSEDKGIHLSDEDITCFIIGEETEFYIEADPTVESYEWIFPEEWGVESYVTTNPFDTVVNIMIGNTKGSIIVKGTTCDTIWERSYEISRFAPVLPSDIILDGKSCVNSGLTDTITLIAIGSKEVTSFIWNYPAMWTVLESFDSTIRLITNKDAKGDYQVTLEVENQCGRLNQSISKTILQDGVGIPLTFDYTPGPPANTRVIIKVNPNDPDIYDYEWYTYPNFDSLISPNPSYTTKKQDTANNTYCAIVTSNTLGCSSMECTKPVAVYIDTTSRDSVIVEIIQEEEEISFSNRNNNNSEGRFTGSTANSVEYSASDLTENNSEYIIEESEKKLRSENVDNITVFPNPTKNRINILLKKDADYIELLNTNGITVYRKKCMSRNFELSVDNLQSGLYIIKVMFNGTFETEKLQIVK